MLFLMYISYFLLFVSILASIWGPSSKDEKIKFFPYFLSTVLVFDLISGYLSQRHINNVLLNIIDNIFEFGYFLFFLNNCLREFGKRKFYPQLIIIYLFLALIKVFFIQGIAHFHTYTFILGCLFVIWLCFQYFISLLRYTYNRVFTKDPIFWIITGILVYHALMLPIFSFINNFMNIPMQLLGALFILAQIINILFPIFFTIGFMCKRKLHES